MELDRYRAPTVRMVRYPGSFAYPSPTRLSADAILRIPKRFRRGQRYFRNGVLKWLSNQETRP